MPYASVGDLEIYYEWYGSEGAEPLFLLNGAFGVIGPNSDWSYQLPRFVEHYRVLTYEHRGHGRTRNPANRFDGYRQLADDAVGLLKVLDVPKVHLVGFSDGAITSLELTLRYPQLVTDLVVVGANYRNDETVLANLKNLQPAYIEQHNPAWAATLEQQHGGQGAGYWKRLADQLYAMWMDNPEYTTQELSQISVPTLVMSGQRDPFGHLAQTLDIFHAIPDSELCILPGAAHGVTLQRAEPTTLLILDYLARQQKYRRRANRQG